MSHTHQLEAHYAVLQLDALRHHVVMSFQPTVDLLVAELRERNAAPEARKRLHALLTRYRAVILNLDDVLVAMRGQCGTDRDDLPDDDDDVAPEAERIRQAHAAAQHAAAERERASTQRWCEVEDALYAMRHGGEE